MKKKLRFFLLNHFPQFFSLKLYWTEKLRGENSSQVEKDGSETLLIESNIPVNVVQDGIFEGLNYDVPSICSARAPKIIGSYEAELTASLLQLMALNPKRVINIGSAEGYYAVGLAYKYINLEVIAVDPSIQAEKYLKQLSIQNNVQERVKFIRYLSFDALDKLIIKSQTLLLVDCEGSEIGYLNPQRVPNLKYCNILVETHDFVHPSITQNLIGRFEKTHTIETISQQNRDHRNFPISANLTVDIGNKLINEKRPSSIKWLLMKSKMDA